MNYIDIVDTQGLSSSAKTELETGSFTSLGVYNGADSEVLNADDGVEHMDSTYYFKKYAGSWYRILRYRSGRYIEVDIPVGAMKNNTTSGATTGDTETSTNALNFDTLDFAVGDLASFNYKLPSTWGGGTLKAKFDWTGGSSGTVIWGIRAVAVGNGDAIDASWGTSTQEVISDTYVVNTQLNITDATPAITVEGSNIVGKRIFFEIERVGGSMSSDATLIGVTIQYQETTVDPSSW